MRYLHRWFEWFERHTVPWCCRVLAAAVGTVVTGVLLGTVLAVASGIGIGLSIGLQLPLALALWIALAMLEEHDGAGRRAWRGGPPRPPGAGVREPRRPPSPFGTAPGLRRAPQPTPVARRSWS